MASLSKASVPAKDLRPLKRVKASELVLLTPPSTLIRTDEDVEHWKNTQGYEDYSLFIRRLNESVVGHFLPDTSEVVQHNDSSVCLASCRNRRHLAHFPSVGGARDPRPPR